MKLKKIEVVNFRSIAEMDIYPTPSCQGFVGINESGKTNILKAIALLSPDRGIDKNDARIEDADEEHGQNSYVEYFFSLDKSDMDKIVMALLEKIYVDSSLPMIPLNGRLISISDFFSAKNTGLHFCNISAETKTSRYYRLNKDEIVSIPELKKAKDSSTSQITSKTKQTILLSQYRFVEKTCIDEAHLSLFADCTTNDLNIVFGSIMSEYVAGNLPKVIYWEYNPQFLLPPSISIESFKQAPNSCLPLKSMFSLAGYDDVKTAIESALSGRKHALSNILRKVSAKSTEYLHKVWSDYKQVRFELKENGSNIDIIIIDAGNYFDCDQRSDGFKRFVTFLLALSAPVNNGEIENSIIVIDEPDLGIHILGQKNLLHELKRISLKNLVFYSTHSIFMIDKAVPDSHFIVAKSKGITNIEQVSTSNLTDDEVIYNALGYSIFEALKQKNIIFEGWSDKRVFEVVIKSKRRGKPSGKLDDIGFVHSTGVRGIIGIAKDLELANREYFVISDSDNPAIDKRNDYTEKEQCVGAWYFYNEIVQGIHTLEDFILHDSYKDSIAMIRENHTELVDFDYAAFKSIVFRREEYIRKWIGLSIKGGNEVKAILKELKDHLYTNLKATDVEKDYITFLVELRKRSLI